MKKLNDPKRLNTILAAHHIRDWFSDRNLPFELYSFDKGEYLNNDLDPCDYFSFVVSGTIRILNVRDDGSMYEISSRHGFETLGDTEFGSGERSPYLVEVVRKTYCVSLPLRQCREKLENDPVFLRFVLRNLASKMIAVTATLSGPTNLTESLLHYIEENCPDHVISGMERTACALACSKRQLLRIVKELCQSGQMVKLGKGRYRLIR